jgi:hypothetical protein
LHLRELLGADGCATLFRTVPQDSEAQKKESELAMRKTTRDDRPMRIALALVLLTACTDNEPTAYDCDVLQKTVSQAKGTCRIDSTGLLDPFSSGCPASIGAYCQPDGVSCPTGWQVDCEGAIGEPEHNCTYIGECTTPGAVSTFNYVQTLNGIQGLGVMREDGRCEFRPCSQL